MFLERLGRLDILWTIDLVVLSSHTYVAAGISTMFQVSCMTVCFDVLGMDVLAQLYGSMLCQGSFANTSQGCCWLDHDVFSPDTSWTTGRF